MTTHPPLPRRGRSWLLGVLTPALLTAAAWTVIVALLPRLPDPVALHWGPSGVDRTGSVAQLIVLMAVLSGVSLLVMAVLAVFTGRQSVTRRMTLGLAVALATLWAGISLASVAVQVDATSATEVASPEGWLIASLAASAVLGVVAGGLAGADPVQPASGEVPADVVTANLPEGHRAVWLRSVAGLGPTVTWIVLVVGVVVAAGLWLLADTVVPLIVLLPLLVLMLTMTTWHVQVDSRGLTVRGALGWPRLQAAATEIDRADVITVRPLREFGGWGLRSNVAGTVGVVVRTGEAIAVERTGGRRLVVTVDDAASGVALLNTYAQRARTEGAR